MAAEQTTNNGAPAQRLSQHVLHQGFVTFTSFDNLMHQVTSGSTKGPQPHARHLLLSGKLSRVHLNGAIYTGATFPVHNHRSLDDSEEGEGLFCPPLEMLKGPCGERRLSVPSLPSGHALGKATVQGQEAMTPGLR